MLLNNSKSNTNTNILILILTVILIVRVLVIVVTIAGVLVISIIKSICKYINSSISISYMVKYISNKSIRKMRRNCKCRRTV